MGRLLALAGVGALALVFTVIWMVPLVSGPFSIECGALGRADCERAWRQVAGDEGVTLLPVTAVRITEATATNPICGTFIIERWIFTTVTTNDCL